MSEYEWDPNRKDWDNGFYKDALGRYKPLNGMNPDQVGDGGAVPRIYYKVEKPESDEKQDKKTGKKK